MVGGARRKDSPFHELRLGQVLGIVAAQSPQCPGQQHSHDLLLVLPAALVEGRLKRLEALVDLTDPELSQTLTETGLDTHLAGIRVLTTAEQLKAVRESFERGVVCAVGESNTTEIEQSGSVAMFDLARLGMLELLLEQLGSLLERSNRLGGETKALADERVKVDGGRVSGPLVGVVAQGESGLVQDACVDGRSGLYKGRKCRYCHCQIRFELCESAKPVRP